jgi:hypothetical protein
MYMHLSIINSLLDNTHMNNCPSLADVTTSCNPEEALFGKTTIVLAVWVQMRNMANEDFFIEECTWKFVTTGLPAIRKHLVHHRIYVFTNQKKHLLSQDELGWPGRRHRFYCIGNSAV